MFYITFLCMFIQMAPLFVGVSRESVIFLVFVLCFLSLAAWQFTVVLFMRLGL